jgi:hypothetical protein
LAGALGLLFLVISLSSTRQEIRFGSDQFNAGSAEAIAERIAEDRRPDCYPDPSPGGDRPICIVHVGDDASQGWITVVVQVDGCPVQWGVDTQEFADSCTGTRYPADGKGLARLPTSVRDGQVVVDVSPDAATSTTAAETTTTILVTGG